MAVACGVLFGRSGCPHATRSSQSNARAPCRAGVHAAVAEVSRLGVPMTVLFFTSPENKSRHVRCSTRALKSFMLSVSEEHEEGLHT